MDTTTVNFAINKMAEAWHSVTPTVQNVSEKYVHFVVMQQFAETGQFAALAVLLTLIGGTLLFIGYKKWDDWDDGAVFVSAIGGAVIIIACVLACMTFSSLSDSFIAYTNPEMFTIQKLIDGVRK